MNLFACVLCLCGECIFVCLFVYLILDDLSVLVAFEISYMYTKFMQQQNGKYEFFFVFSRLFVFIFKNLIVMAATAAAANPHLSQQKKTNVITTANTLHTHI